MFGLTSTTFPVILSIVLLATVTDLWKGKIYNWLTLPALVLGLAYVATFQSDIGNHLLAVLVAFLLFGWMFFFGFMGGGDVKLLMAIAAWGGLDYCIHVSLLSILIGGILAIFQLIFRKELGSFLRKLYEFLLSFALKELRLEKPKLNRKLKLPFGVAISIASIWVAISNPLVHLGMR